MEQSGNTYNPDENFENAPKWMQYLPFLCAGGYFIYSHLIRKHDMFSSLMISGIIGAGAAIPWLSYSPAAMSGSAMGTGNDLDKMNKAGRKTAIDYIVGTDLKNDEGKTFIIAPPSEQKRRDAYNSLTNDELKALYLFYVARDKSVSGETSEADLKSVAGNAGISIPEGGNISENAVKAMAKAVKFMNA